ncbi:four-carbon acid sugar kinase family protein [Microbacterium timonense]|uniref:four-carbon acid sugar kinase family protein n=1 Tax=Microbacterium timonense TaxID=2086576 RepID=UPI000D0E5F40|nr:four-carbon acid sugar kinase family protein [Microbacterium timonense]
MKTVVFDDDPTGTQSASGVDVLLDADAESLHATLAAADSVYIQTNSRAIDEATAVALLRRLRDDARAAAGTLSEDVQFVLRGDSTLRGHVFPETAVFLEEDSVIVFCPAFPAGGRTTVGGVHYVRIGDENLPAHETEYAQDPVFPFRSAVLAEYVADKSGRSSVNVPLTDVRAGRTEAVIASAPAGAVVLPDAETDDDIRAVAAGIVAARRAGRSVVVRSAAPLAAILAGVQSDGLLPTPLTTRATSTLVACGSHTAGATAQLTELEARHGPAVVIPTDAAFADPEAAGLAAAAQARARLVTTGLAIVATERHRRPDHNTLTHGELVMRALTTAVRDLVRDVEAVVAKGGITSAELARTGVGATRARVRGQVLDGVSVWDLVSAEGEDRLYVVVPGNVGSPSTLVDVAAALGH